MTSESRALAEVAPRLRIPTALDRFEPFPLDALPEILRRYVEAQAASLRCDASYIALPLLASLGTAIGNTRRIELKSGWVEPAVLWMVIVGESGSMKSPAFRAALSAMRGKQRGAFDRYNLEMAEYRREKSRYDIELKRWRRRLSESQEDMFVESEPDEPRCPTLDRFMVGDTTLEALVPILEENPRGVLIAWDELSGWFGSFDRYVKSGSGGGDVASWLSMHGADMLTVDRKTGSKPRIVIPSAFASLTGGIQPGVLRRFLGERARQSGLAARLLFAMPPRQRKVWSEVEVQVSLLHEMDLLIDRLLSLQPERKADREWTPRVIPLSESARKAWIEAFTEHNEHQQELEGDEGAAWSKLEATIARIALIDHEVRVAARDPTVSDAFAISTASIACGARLARWFGAEMLRIYAILDEPDHQQDARRLADWIRRRGGRATANQVCHGIRRFRGDPEAAQRALEALVESGVCREVPRPPGPRGGKPTIEWVIEDMLGEPGLKPIGSIGIGSSDTPGVAPRTWSVDDGTPEVGARSSIQPTGSGRVLDGGIEPGELQGSPIDPLRGVVGGAEPASPQSGAAARRDGRQSESVNSERDRNQDVRDAGEGVSGDAT
jgi:hypothetical protein